MADSSQHLSGAARQKVDAALKATVESQLARGVIDIAGGAAGVFSKGVIFSKTDPFSRGIIFSKQAGAIRPDEGDILQQTVGMDEVAFHAFADRLIKMKQIKGGQSGGPAAGG